MKTRKRLLALSLSAMLLLSACGGNGAFSRDKSSENDSASVGQSQQEEMEAPAKELDQAQPEKELDQAQPAEEPEV